MASAPFSQTLNAAALFKARGDMSSGEIKKLKEEISVMAQLDLLVSEKGAEEVRTSLRGNFARSRGI